MLSRVKTLVALFTALFLPLLTASVQAAPNVDEILRKFIAQGENSKLAELRNEFAYNRTSRVDYLEDDGKVKRTRVRVYRVAPENGEVVTRLVSVNGRPAKEKTEKKRSQMRETGEKSRTIGISDELLGRFEFSFLREETLEGRPMWVLSFVPKKNPPNDELLDKLMNAMTGTIWIDQEESQMAKAQLKLSKKVSFFAGIAGAVEKLNLTLVQRRIEPLVWLSEGMHLDFSGRQLFSSMQFRCFESCTDFEKVSEDYAKGPNLDRH